MDGTEKNVNIDSFSTCQDVCDEIMNLVGIDTIHLREFTLYEVSGDYGMFFALIHLSQLVITLVQSAVCGRMRGSVTLFQSGSCTKNLLRPKGLLFRLASCLSNKSFLWIRRWRLTMSPF